MRNKVKILLLKTNAIGPILCLEQRVLVMSICLILCSALPGKMFSQVVGNEWIDYNKTYYKFGVVSNRVFRISGNILNTAGLGTVPAEHFQLWRNGVEQPILTSVASGPIPGTGYIEFQGKLNDGSLDTELYTTPGEQMHPDRSLYTDTSWYYLTVNTSGPNKRFAMGENAVLQATIAPTPYFRYKLNIFRNQWYMHYGFAMPNTGQAFRSARYEQGEGFCGKPFNFDYPTDVGMSNLRAHPDGPPMNVFMSFGGNVFYTRNVKIQLNGDTVKSTYVYQYNLAKDTVKNIPLSRLINDGMTFRFTTDNRTWNETVSPISFEIEYHRRFFINVNTPFEFNLPSKADGHHLRIGGIPHANIPPALYDLTNLKKYTGVIKADSVLFLLDPSASERKLFVATQHPNHLLNINQLIPVNFLNFAEVQYQADYLIIASRALTNANPGGENYVHAYENYRKSQMGGSYNAKIFDLDQLADQFAYGVRKHPLAIRRFLNYAVKNFSIKPKMTLLIGKAVPYENYRITYGPTMEYLNSVPTWGTPYSDNMLAAANNMNPVPIIPIGRISAINNEEVGDYLTKVKQYDSLQQKSPVLPENNEWRKQVVHLNGSEEDYLSSIFKDRFNVLESKIKGEKIGARVISNFRTKNPNYPNKAKEIEERINKGVGLITYFGHSSASRIDYSLENPDLFTNSNGRYPVFIGFGCRAGNMFAYDNNRFISKNNSISEKMVFAKEKGMIAFISNTDLTSFNPITNFTNKWYDAASGSKYGKTLGEIQQEALRTNFAINGDIDYYIRSFVEQVVLHGDPAIVPFPDTLPDFAVETKQIINNPNNINTGDDTLRVQVKYYNLGRAFLGDVLLNIERELPDGTRKMLISQRVANMMHEDSITVAIDLKGIAEAGTNYIIATINPFNEWVEKNTDNNTAIAPFVVKPGTIKPVYPYNYSIVNNQDITLKASTPNAAAGISSYRFQIDTTALFNSPLLVTKDTITIGGAVSWKPGMAYLNNTVYYWRTAYTNDADNWESSSFVYISGGGTGYNQSHFYQHLSSTGKSFQLQEDRKFQFGDKINHLHASHGIYGYSGWENSDFSITVDGLMDIYSACIGSSIIFNVFDSATFKKWENDPGGAYGSAGYCNFGRKYNFEFYYYSHANRKKIMDFVAAIPRGHYVSARMVLDPPHDSARASFWKRDTLIYGSGQSLYHTLFNQGFSTLDSLNRAKTFFFVFKKDDTTSYKPFVQMSEGLLDRVISSVFLPTKDTTGAWTSPVMGPAKSWQQLQWKGSLPGEGDWAENTFVELWGISRQGARTLLKIFPSHEDNIDISAYPASLYPYMSIRLSTTNLEPAKPPYQLGYWRLYYTPMPDGALSALDHFVAPTQTLRGATDSLKVQIAFKNISPYPLDATSAIVRIVNADGTSSIIKTIPIAALPAGDTTILNIVHSVAPLQGDYLLHVEVNEERNPFEVHYYNNRALIPFSVDQSALPLNLLTFTAKAVDKKSQLDWMVKANPKHKSFTIEHSLNGTRFDPIGLVTAIAGIEGSVRNYNFLHNQPGQGNNYYRIKVTDVDGTIHYSEIRLVVFTNQLTINVLPNPFVSGINVVPNNINASWNYRIINAKGQIIKSGNGRGNQVIDGSAFPSGLYWFEWTIEGVKGIKTIQKQ